jgi:hypothetical protein
MNSIIFVIGPCWKNLNTLLETIRINKTMVPNIKKIYIPTNDRTVETHFKENPQEGVMCKYVFKNINHQISCFNCVVSAMHMILEHEMDDASDDIVIFSHEDCYVKNMDLFNNAIKKIEDEKYEIVCREFDAPSCRGHYDKYFMCDTFFIRKSAIAKCFENVKLLNNLYHFGDVPPNVKSYHKKNKQFCEAHFTRAIQGSKIYSILYGGSPLNRKIAMSNGNKLDTHGTWKNTELGFYHIPGRI